MSTDLTPLRSLSLKNQLRLAPLDKWRAGAWDGVPDSSLPIRVGAGRSHLFMALVRHRFPIRGLSLRTTTDGDFHVDAQVVGLAHFPEQSTQLPDPLLGGNGCDVAANTTQSFLIRVRTSEQTTPGRYRLHLRTDCASHEDTELLIPVEITPAIDLRTATDPADVPLVNFWPHWYSLARYYGVAVWSEPFWTLVKAYLQELAAGGMNVATAFICDDAFRYPLPETHYHFNHFPGMVAWSRRAGGDFTFDYTIYDRYITTNLALGIDREIECHAMLPCKDQLPVLTYHDEALGRYVHVETRYDAPAYRQAWSAFLRSFVQHNKRRGWSKLLTLCIYDEPQNLESFRGVVGFVREEAPDIRITSAIGCRHAEQLHDVLDIATLNASLDLPAAAGRLRRMGKAVRWYNCCEPAWANTLFECPLIDAYRLSWITAANQLNGFLRWSAFAWTDDPVRDPAFNWPTGDTCLLYPGPDGPWSSLRWEAYKLGREDLAMAQAVLPNADEAIRAQLEAHAQALGKMAPMQANQTITHWRERLTAIFDVGSKPRLNPSLRASGA